MGAFCGAIWLVVQLKKDNKDLGFSFLSSMKNPLYLFVLALGFQGYQTDQRPERFSQDFRADKLRRRTQSVIHHAD